MPPASEEDVEASTELRRHTSRTCIILLAWLALGTVIIIVLAISLARQSASKPANQPTSKPDGQPACIPGQPTFHKMSDPYFFTMAFPCGLTDETKVRKVQVRAADGTPCMFKDKRTNTFASMSCGDSCATKDLDLVVTYTNEEGATEEKTVTVKDEKKDRLKACHIVVD